MPRKAKPTEPGTQDPNNPQAAPEGEEGLEQPSFPPIGEEAGDGEGDGGEPDPVTARLEALETQFEREKESWAERERRQQDTIDRLIQGQIAPVAGGQQADRTPTEVDWNDLPDPVEKPDEFKRAIAEKTRAQFEMYQQSSGTAQQRAQQLDQLWNSFQTEYPDLAKHEATAQGATALEAQAMRARGVDPQQAILADPNGFKSRIAERMRKELGTGGDDGQGDEHGATRTDGVAGGSRPATKPKSPDRGKGFMQQMKDVQLKDGLI